MTKAEITKRAMHHYRWQREGCSRNEARRWTIRFVEALVQA